MAVMQHAPSEDAVWPWPTYSFQPLPNLSATRKPVSKIGQLHSFHSIPGIGTLSEHGIVWQDVLLAAFVKLVCLYVDTSDFIFAELRKDIPPSGFRALLHPEQSWTDLSRAIRDLDRCSVSHADARTSFGIPESHNPFPASIAWGAKVEDDDAVSGLVVQVSSLTKGKIFIGLRWDHAVFSESVAQTFSSQLLSLFDIALSDPSRSCNGPQNLDPRLLSVSNAQYDPEEAHCATDWLARNAELRPNAIAHEIYTDLQSQPRLVTYREFNQKANQLAHWLLDNGLQLEDRVAVCRTRDLQFSIAHAAIFKAGGCYVSIDPELPDERKRHIAEDSGARFVFTNASCLGMFTSSAYSLDLQEFLDHVSTKDTSDVAEAQLDSLAYLLYTSGTTGKPKGCLLNHRGLYWAIEAMCKYPRDVTNPDTDKRLAMASIAFDVHISEICQVWSLGIRLVSAPRFELLSRLQDNIRELGITHLAMVPSMIEAALNSPDDLPLKYMVSGGEKISDFVLETWANNPKVILANFYGPTEVTIGCTSRRISADDRKDNIGKPFPACSAYLVDAEMNIVLLGQPGELIIEGPLVARGYHNLPEVTARSFIEWPNPGCRAYRTGDLVRMSPEGTLHILGRIDSQIKLRGVRIESDGISEVVRKATDQKLVAHTLIAIHPDVGSDCLVSFFVRDDPSISVEKKRTAVPGIDYEQSNILAFIRNHVNKELAVYMRPAHIVPVEFLPLTLNGKIDGKKLAAVFAEMPLRKLMSLQSNTSEGKQRKATEPEALVISCSSKICNVPEANLNSSSNLFECGFDSLKFNALTRELRKRFSVSSLSVAEIIENPVVEVIARLCQDRDANEDQEVDTAWLDGFSNRYRDVAEAAFQPEDIDAILPSLPIQDGILAQSMESKEAYVQNFLYRLKADINLERLKKAWLEVIARQDILRAVFVLDSDTLQVILSPQAAGIPWFLHELEQDTEFSEWFAAEEIPRIAIEINEDISSPMFRLNLYHSTDSTYLAISIHHSLYDGIAFPLLMREVDAVYSNEDLSTPISLYVVVQQLNSCQRPERSKEFWVSQFEDANLVSRGLHRPSGKTTRSTKTLDISLQDLRARCGTMHTTLEALFASTFAHKGQALFGWSRDAVFGLIRSGRMSQSADLERAICPLVSVVPLRIHLEQKNNMELLQSCQNRIAKIIPHEHTPLGSIQRWLGLPELIDVLFSCREETEANQYRCFEHIPLPPPVSEFAFALEVVFNSLADTAELRVTCTSEGDLGTRTDEMLETFETSLLSMSDVSNETEISSGKSEGFDGPPTAIGASDPQTHVDPQVLNSIRSQLSTFLRVDIDSIFEGTLLLSLGLDSLKAVAISRRLEEQGVLIQPVDMMRAGTVRHLAMSVNTASPRGDMEDEAILARERMLSEDLDMKTLKLDANDDVRITMATALQAGMLSQTIASSGELYVHGFTFELLPGCQIEKLKGAWKDAITALEILRTSFHFSPTLGTWAQVIHSFSLLQFTREKRASLGSATKEFIASLPFNQEDAFDRPPLYIHQVSCETEYLIVVLHHALYDGVSLPILFGFVRELYKDRNQPPPLPQFSTISKAMVASEDAATTYWEKRLQMVKSCTYPRLRSAFTDAWRSSKRIDLPLSSIQRFCRRYQVAPQAVAQAAWATILATKLQRLDIVFGQVVSGRTLRGSEAVIGPVFNTIPCRVSLKKQQTWKDLTRSVHQSNLDCLPWHHASLRAIQKALHTSELCDTLFLFQPEATQLGAENTLWHSVSRSDEVETKSQYAINIEVHQEAEGWVIRSSCSADAMDTSGLEQLLEEFATAINRLISSPGDRILPRDFQPTSLMEESEIENTWEKPTVIETEWDHQACVIRGILSKFAKIPEEMIAKSSSLASMGIDSISALQISALARREGISISPVDVVQSITVDDLLGRSPDESASSQLSLDVEIKPPMADTIITTLPRSFRSIVENIYPVTAGMEWIIGTWQRSGGIRFQHAFVRRFTGRLELPRIEQTWNKLLQKHPILRATFVPVVRSSTRIALCVFDVPKITVKCRKLSGKLPEMQALAEEAHRSVEHPPPAPGLHARLTLLEGKSNTYLIINLHHFQYDAGSLPVLFKDLEAIYLDQEFECESDLNRHVARLTPSPSQKAEQEAYWKGRFPSGWKPRMFLSSLNSQTGHRTNHIARGVVKSLKILQDAAKKLDLLFPSVLLASWAKLQALRSSSADVAFGLWHSGRTATLTMEEPLALPCLNFLPLRIANAGYPLVDLARNVMKDLQKRAGIVEQSNIADISIWAGHSGASLCNVYVNILSAPTGNSGEKLKEENKRRFEPVKLPYRVPGLVNLRSNGWKDAFQIPEVQADCIVEIFFNLEEDSIGMGIECDSSMLNEVEAQQLAEDWAAILKELLAPGSQ